MRSALAVFRRSVVPRWALALAVALHVLAGGMPMPRQTSAAISDPAAVALALLSPDICHTPVGPHDRAPPPHHHADCLLCPVCLAHAAVTASAPPLLPGAPTRLVSRIRPLQPGELPAGPVLESPRARGPPVLSA